MDVRTCIENRKWAILFNQHIVKHIIHTHICIPKALQAQRSSNDLWSMLSSRIAIGSSLGSSKFRYQICALRLLGELPQSGAYFECTLSGYRHQPAQKMCNVETTRIERCAELNTFEHGPGKLPHADWCLSCGNIDVWKWLYWSSLFLNTCPFWKQKMVWKSVWNGFEWRDIELFSRQSVTKWGKAALENYLVIKNVVI